MYKLFPLFGVLAVCSSLAFADQQAGETTNGSEAIDVEGLDISDNINESISDNDISNNNGCQDFSSERQPFFGDLHIHTRYSLDARTQDTRTTPNQAYRFAKGEALGIQPWNKKGKALRNLQLERPLDFAMVSDHAELFGEVNICETPTAAGYQSWQCLLYRYYPRGAYYYFNFMAMREARRPGFCGEQGRECKQAAKGPWDIMQMAAARHNDDCHFTTFVGYEWTGVKGNNAANLHRNVVFRNETVPQFPFSFVDGPDPELLWGSLETTCNNSETDCDSLTIPHNSNVSSGLMFRTVNSAGSPITAANAKLRRKYEPLVEIMQHKGASECFYGIGGTADELCAFEQLTVNGLSIIGTDLPKPGDGFVREVLRDGILAEQRMGENPFKWGFIGSTDTHLGAAGAVNESKFLGHGGAGVPSDKVIPPGLPDNIEFNPGGLAVIWAEQNTRDSLFDAMLRRETYATSGPRIIARFFGGWDFPQDMCGHADFATRGYAQGVAMGGDLLPAPWASNAPVFAVSAEQDPGTSASYGTALQRIQIIKGWIDLNGQRQEKVYDVAGDRNNGASVDTSSCELSGEGFGTLCTVWRDPQFNAKESAYYYARIVENPSCRWSQKICAAKQVDCSKPATITKGLEACCEAKHRPIIQERAWTSPIWYR